MRWFGGAVTRNGRVLHAYTVIAFLLHGRSKGRLGMEAIATMMGMSIRSAELAVTELDDGHWIKPRR